MEQIKNFISSKTNGFISPGVYSNTADMMQQFQHWTVVLLVMLFIISVIACVFALGLHTLKHITSPNREELEYWKPAFKMIMNIVAFPVLIVFLIYVTEVVVGAVIGA